MLGKYSIQLPFTKQKGTGTCNLGPDDHWRNFALKSGVDQWRRQDLVSAGHDNRGASIEVPKAPCGLGYGEGCLLSSRLRIWWSVVSSPSRVRGGVPAAVAFSAYFRPQNASGSNKKTFSCPKYKFHFEKVVVTVTIVTYKVALMALQHGRTRTSQKAFT